MGVPGAEVKVLPEISDGSKKKNKKKKHYLLETGRDAIVQKSTKNIHKQKQSSL